jgi:hypothetical protein
LTLLLLARGALQQLPLPLAVLDRVNGMVSGDLLDRLAATDSFHGAPGLELGTVGAALAHRWEAPGGGDAPPQRLTMGVVQKNQSTSPFPASPLRNLLLLIAGPHCRWTAQARRGGAGRKDPLLLQHQ